MPHCMLPNAINYEPPFVFPQYTLNSETGQFYHKDTQHSVRKLLNDISYDEGRMTYHHTVTQPAPSFKASVHLAATSISFLP